MLINYYTCYILYIRCYFKYLFIFNKINYLIKGINRYIKIISNFLKKFITTKNKRNIKTSNKNKNIIIKKICTIKENYQKDINYKKQKNT